MDAVLIVFTLFGIAFYMLPSAVAVGRSHSSTLGIFVLNLLLGWTVLIWIGALVWACSGQHEKPQTA